MTQEKIEIQFYKMAFQAIGLHLKDQDVDLLINLIKIVDKKQGQTDLKDIFETRFNVYSLYGQPMDEYGRPIDG